MTPLTRQPFLLTTQQAQQSTLYLNSKCNDNSNLAFFNKNNESKILRHENIKQKTITNNNNNGNKLLNNIFNIFDVSNQNLAQHYSKQQTQSQQVIRENLINKNYNNNVTITNKEITKTTGRSQFFRSHKNDTSLLAKQINLNSLANMMMLRQQQQNNQINANIIKNSN